MKLRHISDPGATAATPDSDVVELWMEQDGKDVVVRGRKQDGTVGRYYLLAFTPAGLELTRDISKELGLPLDDELRLKVTP